MDTLYQNSYLMSIGFVTKVNNSCCRIGNMTFVTWLETELNKRNWKRSDLARAIKMSDTALTLVYNGQRKPGTDMCLAIAKVFDLPPELVYRQAGLLPEAPDLPPEFEELKHWFSQMTDDEQEVFLAQGRLTIELRNKRRKKSKERQQPSPENG